MDDDEWKELDNDKTYYDGMIREYFRPYGIEDDQTLIAMLNEYLHIECTSLLQAFRVFFTLPQHQQREFAPFVFALQAAHEQISYQSSGISFRVRSLIPTENDVDVVFRHVSLTEGALDILSDICDKFRLHSVPETHTLVAEYLDMEADDPNIAHEALSMLHSRERMEELENFISYRRLEMQIEKQTETSWDMETPFNKGSAWEPTVDPSWGYTPDNDAN